MKIPPVIFGFVCVHSIISHFFLSINSGKGAVRSILENENFQLDIQRNGYDSDGDKLSTALYNGKSSGGLININDELNEITEVLVYNGYGANVYEVSESYILMGHEMIHAYHHMNNTFNDNRNGLHFYYDEKGILQSEQYNAWKNEEYETVGLNYIHMYNSKPDPRSINRNVVLAGYNSITENKLRMENGLRTRAAYKTRTKG